MKNITKFLSHRVVIVGVLLTIQFLILLGFILKFSDYIVYFYTASLILSTLVVIFILSGRSNPGYKIAWVIPIIIFPIFGGLLYVIFGGSKLSKRSLRKMDKIRIEIQNNYDQNINILKLLKQDNLDAYAQSYYINNSSLSPVYQNTKINYFKIGEEMYEDMLKKLRTAKKFIFMEFFIVEDGVMWNTILEILEQKVKDGLDVRFLYDDMGCIMTLPNKYYKVLRSKGIKCCSFNPFIPILTARLNNRDHRKIMVIDGVYAYTGGINIADEYINATSKYGHWKDNGVLLEGEGVKSFTIMFLTLWNYITNEEENCTSFFPDTHKTYPLTDGYVQPYNDTPLDLEATGETIYLNMIGRAKKYIYITTPYLIVDNEMVTLLCNAAKSGIDVKIIVPGIADKKIVNEVTKSYYNVFIDSGVKIYEYTPGFIHAKTFICDDVYSIVGTVNLDYRSLYLHFECGVWMYKTSCIKDITDDFNETLKVSKEITGDDLKKIGFIRILFRAILKIFAPLM